MIVMQFVCHTFVTFCCPDTLVICNGKRTQNALPHYPYPSRCPCFPPYTSLVPLALTLALILTLLLALALGLSVNDACVCVRCGSVWGR